MKKTMRILNLYIAVVLMFCAFPSKAQNGIEEPIPTALLIDKDGVQIELAEGENYEGEAPLDVQFRSNATEAEGYSMVCTWTFMRDDKTEPILVRYDTDVDYEFREAGLYSVILQVAYTSRENPELVIEWERDPFVISISESSLKVPNAFSPNGDGINDFFNVYDVKSIVKFNGAIYNRWGQQLYTWGIDDIGCEGCGWDGTYKGADVKDGVYFVVINARGADGIVYEIKSDVNLLRGFSEEVMP